MSKAKIEADPMIGSKSIAQWNEEWVDISGGFAKPQPRLFGFAGLYRGIENGEVVVLGKAAGIRPKNRLSKRLDDFLRPGNSGRDDHVGSYIHKHRRELSLQVLVTGTDQAACDVATKLREPMIKVHNPRENRPLKVRNAAAFD